MKVILLLPVPFLFGLLSLVMLLTWYTAFLLFMFLGIISILCVRNNDKHSHMEYDDHLILTEERYKQLIEVITKCGKLD